MRPTPEDRRATLLVPTFNRPEFVARLLRYYAQMGFTGSIAIGDSSDAHRFSRTADAVAAYRDRLDVIHVPAPGLGIGPCLRALANRVTTPYAATLPDDDFIVPKALDRCCAFLDDHPDYAAAHGQGITLTLDTNGLHGNVVHCGHYTQPALEADSATQRYRDHMTRYAVTLFSVMRADDWRTILADVDSIADVPFSAEILPCCLSVVLGKIKELDGLYLVRQSHNLRIQLPTMYDWVVGERFHAGYVETVDRLARALAAKEGVDVVTARATITDGFRDYIGLGVGLRRRMGHDDWMLALARRGWHLVQALRPKPLAEWELPALTAATSPEHDAFMPVYRALMTPPDAQEGPTGR